MQSSWCLLPDALLLAEQGIEQAPEGEFEARRKEGKNWLTSLSFSPLFFVDASGQYFLNELISQKSVSGLLLGNVS